MKEWGIYSETGVLELVAFVRANTYEEAVEKTKTAGYGKAYRIQELDDYN